MSVGSYVKLGYGERTLGISQCKQATKFFFSSRRRHTRCLSDWSSDVCSSDLQWFGPVAANRHVSESTGTDPRINTSRSEERRVGKECRSRKQVDRKKKKVIADIIKGMRNDDLASRKLRYAREEELTDNVSWRT